jgi:hypothetical protein
MDPSSGRLTPLYGSDRHVTDLHRGVSAGIRSTYDPGTRVETNQVFVGYGVPERIITIPGVAAPDHLTDDALVSPDGAWIAASLTAEGGCGGVPEVRTAIVDTETGALHIITDFFAQAWVDSSHLAGYRETARTDPATGQQLPERDPHLLLADLGGTIVDLPKGTFLAVIAGTDAAPRLERPAR